LFRRRRRERGVAVAVASAIVVPDARAIESGRACSVGRISRDETARLA